MSKFIISVGHTASGNIGSGACDLLDESNCTREVAPLVVNKLKSLGHEAVLLRVDKSNSYNCEDCYVRANQANNTGGDLFVEIHFNSGINRQGDGSEVCIISNNSKAKPYAERISSELANTLGITNRGVKVMSLIVLNKTSMPSCLVECQFVDGKNANNTYNSNKIANAIVKGLTGQTVNSTKQGWNENNKGWWYCTDIAKGYYYKDEWKLIDGYYYRFDENGYCKTGWIKEKGRWYYLCETRINDYPKCSMLKGWFKYKDKYCYLIPFEDKENGFYEGQCLVDCKYEIDRTNYFFDKDGYIN